MINIWKERRVTLKPNQMFQMELTNPDANMIQIINRTASGGGNVFMGPDRNGDVSATDYEVKVEQGKTGALVKPYALKTVNLWTDSATDLIVIVTEIVVENLSVVFNASQVVNIQGSVQVAQPVQVDGTVGISGEVEVKNDTGNPIPTAPATPSAVLNGIVALTTAASNLSVASVPCKEVTVKADPTNTTNVLVGNSAGQHYILAPGDSLLVHIDDLSKVYAVMASGTGNLVYLGVN